MKKFRKSIICFIIVSIVMLMARQVFNIYYFNFHEGEISPFAWKILRRNSAFEKIDYDTKSYRVYYYGGRKVYFEKNEIGRIFNIEKRVVNDFANIGYQLRDREFFINSKRLYLTKHSQEIVILLREKIDHVEVHISFPVVGKENYLD
jgi:hypothetical protein